MAKQATGPARIRSAAGCGSATAPWITVVGVSGDIIQDWFNRRNAPTMYRPMAQAPTDYFGIAVRTAGDPAAAAGAVRQALLRVDPTQPVFEMMTMRRAAAANGRSACSTWRRS